MAKSAETEPKHNLRQSAKDNHQWYPVEKIIGKKITKSGKIKYKVKWRGYPAYQATWKSLRKLKCSQLLQEFEKEIIEQKPSKSKKKTTGRLRFKIKINRIILTKHELKAEIEEKKISIVSDQIENAGENFQLKIVGVVELNGHLSSVMVKTDSSDNLKDISTEEAMIKCPLELLNFYRSIRYFKLQ